MKRNKLEETKKTLEEEFSTYDSLIQQIYETDYTKGRIIKVLQNPFELQKIIEYVKENHSDNPEEAIKNILSNAVVQIKKSIRYELLEECLPNISEELKESLMTLDKFEAFLTKLSLSDIIHCLTSSGSEDADVNKSESTMTGESDEF